MLWLVSFIRKKKRQFQIELLSSTFEVTSIIHYDCNPHNQLTALFDKYGSDKGSNFSSSNVYPFAPHSYSHYYYNLFKRSKESFRKVFECGIGTNNINIASNMGAKGKPGASLRAWRDFFPNAQIVGGDIDKQVLFQEDRISTFFIDQTIPESITRFWDNVIEDDFDLMIDDGLHTYEAGSTLFEYSFDKLKPDGIYVIEDVSFDDILKYEEFFKRVKSKVSVEYVRFYERNKKSNRNSIIVVSKVSHQV